MQVTIPLSRHIMFGLVPMTLLYRAALLRWSPGVINGPALAPRGLSR